MICVLFSPLNYVTLTRRCHFRFGYPLASFQIFVHCFFFGFEVRLSDQAILRYRDRLKSSTAHRIVVMVDSEDNF